MKKILTMILALAMLFTTIAAGTVFAEESEAQPNTVRDYLFEVSDDMSDEEYIWTVEKNFRILKSFELIFTPESFKAFNKTHRTGSREDMEKCNAAVDSLVEIDPIAERIWFLWDEDNMPCFGGTGPDAATIDAESELDFAGFIPFVIKFLQEDQSNVKGNVILVSGGGYSFRSNAGEAYKTYPIFYDLGYNVYILQRRISPYAGQDTYMDLQRAIRLVRYYGEKEGYGGMDMIGAVGWSGGGGTVMGTVENCYGLLTPADATAPAQVALIDGEEEDNSEIIFDPDYVPDEIDAVSSDLDIAMPIYGCGEKDGELVQRNPNLPAFYICSGLADEVVNPEGVQKFCDKLVELGVTAQLFMVPEAVHGFGPGGGSKGGVGSENWPYEADAMMQSLRNGEAGAVEADASAEAAEEPAAEAADAEAVPAAEASEGYTQMKVFDGTYGFGDAEITAQTNDDFSAFLITFEAFDEDQVLEGTIEDGICSVDYDETGFMTGDCQLIWDDAMASENPWEPVQ